MDFLSKEFYGNKVEIWLIALSIIIGSIVLAKLTYWIIGKSVKQITARTKTKLDDILVDKLEEPGVMAIIVICSWYALSLLKMNPNVNGFVENAFILSLAIDITWFVARTLDAFIGEYLAPYAQKSETKFDDTLVPILRKGIRMMVWSIGLIMGLNNAGFDVGALIAGLGIGGLALALASQDTVKNIIGGLIIIMDKPFKIGDRIMIEAHDGTIEDIGVRSTKLRMVDGRQVTIPNMLFSDKPIVNITREPSRRIIVTLGLVYDTKPEKMQLAVDLLKNIVFKHPMIDHETSRAYFSNFSPHSLDVMLIYHIEAGNEYFQVQNEVNQEILMQFKSNSLEFAYPTQTLYTINKD